LPVSAAETLQTGNLGHMPFLVFASGNGLNNTELVHLSTQGKLFLFPNLDHYIPFHKEPAAVVTNETIELIKKFRIQKAKKSTV